MKWISWIISLPLMAVAVVFAIANRHIVTLDLWPLAFSIDLPLFILVLGCLFAGLLIGAIIMWFTSGKNRRRARKAESKAARLERELARLQHPDRTMASPIASKATVAAENKNLPTTLESGGTSLRSGG